MFQIVKVLLLYVYLEFQDFVVNWVLLELVLQLLNVIVYDFYVYYLDFFIDIVYEQDLLCQYEVIVFQYFLYIWSCLVLFKEWLDCVLSCGFVSGVGGNELVGKYWCSVIIIGEFESVYCCDVNCYLMNDILCFFELIVGMCCMYWMSFIIVYWVWRQQLEELCSCVLVYWDWLVNFIVVGGVYGGI